MTARTLSAWAFFVVAVPFLMRFELHTDDTGVEVAFLLIATAILGFLHPRHAWLWAVLVGPAIPLADVLFAKRAVQPGLLLIGLVTTVVCFAGSYAGALASRLIPRDA